MRSAPERDRLDFWFQNTGGRMICTEHAGSGRRPHAEVTVSVAPGVEFLDYRSSGLLMDRTPAMCASDDRDEISLGLVLSYRTGATQNDRELRLRRGDLYVIDFGRPVRSLVTDHHELAINLRRNDVAEALGGNPDDLGGSKLRQGGIAEILRAAMTAIARENSKLSSSERDIALSAASNLALATLKANTGQAVDSERHGPALLLAARTVIERDFADSDLNPERVAQAVGCSRATLYRVFAHHDASVAEHIWNTRLAAARIALSSSGDGGPSIMEAAFRCGFLDPSSFGRMFKRAFGRTPSEYRQMQETSWK
jgi:AraC-like DNA-binding protein